MTITADNRIKTGLGSKVLAAYLMRIIIQKKAQSIAEARKLFEFMVLVEKQAQLPMPDNFDTIIRRINTIKKYN